MSKFFAYLEGLSNKQNEIISKYASISKPNILMIPYTINMVNFIEQVKEILPTNYIVGNNTYKVLKLEYIIKNDYIVLTLVQ